MGVTDSASESLSGPGKGKPREVYVLVTGGRDYTRRETVDRTLSRVHAEQKIIGLATGACPYGGADALAENWARENEVDYWGFPAKFKSLGKAAGPMRNKRMIDEWRPDLVIAFPGGRGTANCIEYALKSGVEVLRVVDYD